QLSLRFADLRRERGERGRLDLLPGESLIERDLLRDGFLADGNRFGFHGLVQLPDAFALFIVELELVRQLKNVARSWISVQFAGQRKAHTAAGTQVGKLLVAKCLERAVLHARIGRL